MERETTKQVNFRLPETLVDDLKDVSERLSGSQTEIVKTAVAQKVERLKKKLNKAAQAA